jgi:hypothetical protein
MNKVLTVIFSFSLLAGCVGNQKFDCPLSGGVQCKSLAEVDKHVDMPDNNKKKAVQKLELKKAPDSPLRTQEEVLSLWVAPYQTEDGTYHEEKMMHFVARPAEWVGASMELTSGSE